MLKGKIDKDGCLWIARPIKLKIQPCPFVSYAENEFGPAFCGDWCPQFGEPERRVLSPLTNKEIHLQICEQRVLVFDEFIDERPTE